MVDCAASRGASRRHRGRGQRKGRDRQDVHARLSRFWPSSRAAARGRRGPGPRRHGSTGFGFSSLMMTRTRPSTVSDDGAGEGGRNRGRGWHGGRGSRNGPTARAGYSHRGYRVAGGGRLSLMSKIRQHATRVARVPAVALTCYAGVEHRARGVTRRVSDANRQARRAHRTHRRGGGARGACRSPAWSLRAGRTDPRAVLFVFAHLTGTVWAPAPG